MRLETRFAISGSTLGSDSFRRKALFGFQELAYKSVIRVIKYICKWEQKSDFKSSLSTVP